MLETKQSWLLIGSGGFGSRLAREYMKTVARGKDGNAVEALCFDTDVNDLAQVPRVDSLHLGGFTVKDAFEKLSEDNPAILRLSKELPRSLMNASLNEGSGQLFELGLVAAELNRGRILQGIRKKISSCFPEGNVSILLVGSLCGGTSSALAPSIGKYIYNDSDLRDSVVRVVGCGFAHSIFQRILPGNQINQAKSNEFKAKAEIKANAKCFTDFQVVSPSENLSFVSRIDACLGFLSEKFLKQITSTTAADFQGSQVSLLLGDGSIESIAEGAAESESSESQRLPNIRFLRKKFFTLGAVNDFTKLVTDTETNETQIQKFLEKHPGILTGFDYKCAVPHVKLVSRDQRKLVPDFMLLPVDGELADILEIKLPKAQLVTRKGRHMKLTSSVESAIAQVRSYHDFFEQDLNREAFHNRYGFTLFRPKLTILIGRKPEVATEIEFRSLVSKNQDIQLQTYDDLINSAKRRSGW